MFHFRFPTPTELDIHERHEYEFTHALAHLFTKPRMDTNTANALVFADRLVKRLRKIFNAAMISAIEMKCPLEPFSALLPNSNPSPIIQMPTVLPVRIWGCVGCVHIYFHWMHITSRPPVFLLIMQLSMFFLNSALSGWLRLTWSTELSRRCCMVYAVYSMT